MNSFPELTMTNVQTAKGDLSRIKPSVLPNNAIVSPMDLSEWTSHPPVSKIVFFEEERMTFEPMTRERLDAPMIEC